MKVTLESTTKIVTVNGVEARVWEGESEHGAPCMAFIVRIACKDGADAAEFDHDLNETREPSPAVQAISLRMIL